MQNHEKRKKTTYDEAETKTMSKNETLKMKSKYQTKETTKKCIKISQRKPCMASEP